MKEESEKVGLKLNIQKMNMAFGPITSWEIDGETVATVSDFILGWGWHALLCMKQIVHARTDTDCTHVRTLVAHTCTGTDCTCVYRD